MATGGPTRSAALGLVLLTGALLTGCAGSAAGEASGKGPSPASASPSPRTTPPAELCARIITYWSRQVLDGDTYGDYQSMGLSNGQYEILRAVVDAARAEQKRQGRAAAEQLIDRQARERCTERYRDGGPTGGPWS
ncbi:hypothetical protein SSP24_17850 [Streptomyces spinoverrucosus]|uniref:Lipoprotein n=1 Tax=Streptomyces spinoverrucosus TaxID=284043 RepID=A0A4Y3VEA0_9ACTN|nr:hypothetical protein [Streptomyces spinoverrucosus]GEC04130.1 hypothetical protein SSP24_17850 [Streptomyces spinoverrucosus]GHB46365.1 hypothetical protein GCM10010397_15310 [Streptomyces spinoverrucosus]